MEFLKLLTLGARKAPVRTLPQLGAAIGEGAAYLSQGASYAYIRARSGTMGPRLMQDAAFGIGMERCKWEGFAAMAGDLILIVETQLRPYGGTAEETWASLYRKVLSAQEIPAHRAEEGWTDRLAQFDLRLAAHLTSAPRGVEELCEYSAGVLLEYAPVEDAIRRLDREMVINNVKFRFIEFVDALRQRADWPALAASLSVEAEDKPR